MTSFVCFFLNFLIQKFQEMAVNVHHLNMQLMVKICRPEVCLSFTFRERAFLSFVDHKWWSGLQSPERTALRPDISGGNVLIKQLSTYLLNCPLSDLTVETVFCTADTQWCGFEHTFEFNLISFRAEIMFSVLYIVQQVKKILHVWHFLLNISSPASFWSNLVVADHNCRSFVQQSMWSTPV